MGTRGRGSAREDGLQRLTFRDGTLCSVGRCAGGRKTGVWKTFDERGTPSRTKTYPRSVARARRRT